MKWFEGFAYRVLATIVVVVVFWNIFALIPGLKSLELLGLQVILPLSVVPAIGLVELLSGRGKKEAE